MRALVTSLVAVMVVLCWLAPDGRAGTAPPPLSRYFSVAELRRSHPESVPGRGYHGPLHSKNTRRMEYDLARSRGLSHEVASFLSEVALLHDWDPHRAAETPPRVAETLRVLAADFAGKRPLIPGYRGTSVLRERFGWTRRDLAVAQALIQRTAFPFDAVAVRRYEARVRRLSRADQRLVLQEGAYLSEYADKASTYAMRRPSGVVRASRGLVREKNNVAGKRVETVAGLESATFLRAIGTRGEYAQDRAIARRLGVRVSFSTRRTVFGRMPTRYGVRFHDSLSRAQRDQTRATARARARARPRAQSSRRKR